MSDEGETFTLNLDVMNEKKNHLTQKHFNSKINGQTFHEDGIFATINAAADWKRGEDMNGRKERQLYTIEIRESRAFSSLCGRIPPLFVPDKTEEWSI
jgi:hypothetical protein